MPHESREFANNEIYHIITLRRIGDKELFNDIDDYYRGIFYIYECNTSQPVVIRERRAARKRFKALINQNKDEVIPVWIDERDFLVEVLAFVLMPNHIHLLLRQIKNKGITKYIHKIASGYAAYFKNKYSDIEKIKGHFFQDRFYSAHINTSVKLQVAFVYIHTNPISLVEPKWKEIGVENKETVLDFLFNRYRWSSLLDYLGKDNFPSVTKREFLEEVMEGPQGIKKAIEDWIDYKHQTVTLDGHFD